MYLILWFMPDPRRQGVAR